MVLHEVVHIANMLESFQVGQNVVLKHEDALVLVLLLDFQGHVLLQVVVIGLVDEAEGSLA